MESEEESEEDMVDMYDEGMESDEQKEVEPMEARGVSLGGPRRDGAAPAEAQEMEMAQQLMALGGMSNIEEAKQLLAVFNYDLNAAVASVLDGGAGPAAGADENAKGPLGAEFASLYEPKYGLLHPIFFNEDYEAAVRAGKSQGRIVCVYVYSDYEEDASDHFCKSVLSRAKLCDTLDESYIFYVCNQRKSSYVINKMMSLASEGGHSDKTMGHPFVAVIMPAIDSGSGDGGFVEPKMLSRMDNVFSADELVAQLDTHWQKYKPRLQDTQASFATIAADRQLKLQQDSELQEAMLMDKHRADTVKFEEAEKEMEQVMADQPPRRHQACAPLLRRELYPGALRLHQRTRHPRQPAGRRRVRAGGDAFS